MMMFGHSTPNDNQVNALCWGLTKLHEAGVDLDHLHDAAEGEGERDEDEQQGDEGQQVGADAGTLLAHCNIQYSTVQGPSLHTDTVIGHFITTFIGAILVLLL